MQSGKYQEYIESKSHTQEHEMSESRQGFRFSLHRIAVEEGGGEAGMKAAVNYCLKCIHLGPPWVLYNEWTENMKFKYVQESDMDKSSETWV